jgi:hypothetical protein
MQEIKHQAKEISLWDKIFDVFSEEIGKEFTRGDIIDLIVEKYPNTNRTSVIPSDYCYNMINKGIYFKNHIFEQLETGYYKVLGTSYEYTGPIFWKGEKVGEWKKGEKQPKFSKHIGK